MEKLTLLWKLETILAQAERLRAWGTIEIELLEAVPNLLLKSTTEKV